MEQGMIVSQKLREDVLCFPFSDTKDHMMSLTFVNIVRKGNKKILQLESGWT